MRKYISLVGAVLSLVNLGSSFMGDFSNAAIFGTEMNIWVYRLIWGSLAAYLFYRFYTQRNQ